MVKYLISIGQKFIFHWTVPVHHARGRANMHNSRAPALERYAAVTNVEPECDSSKCPLWEGSEGRIQSRHFDMPH